MSLSRITLTLSASIVLIGGVFACSDDSASSGSGGSGASSGTSTGGNNTGGAGTSTGGHNTGGAGTSAGGNGQGGSITGTGGEGGVNGSWPVGTTCQGKVYECADGLDNDDDGLIDWADPDCIHPCDNGEGSLNMEVPGANNAPCRMDCFFDSDGGSGNDDCYWDHRCDPISTDPDHYPQPEHGGACNYLGDAAKPPAAPASCGEMFAQQSDQCENYCKPLTPNGCDCFGCCVFPGAPTPVFLDSAGASGTTKCTWDKLGDPTVCHPCTQVAGCLNACDPCEVCIGKPFPDPGCNSGSGGGGQGGGDPGGQCPAGVQACGLPGQAPCGPNQFCLTGCCYAVPS
jgi:hypothetical protein